MQASEFANIYKNAQGVHNPKMDALAQWAERQLTCSHCRKCTNRCEVLDGPALDMGQVQQAYARIAGLPEDEQAAAVLLLVQEQPELYNALRQCCFCGFCTAACRHHVPAPDVMRAWRELFMKANLMPPDDSKLVMVDNEWNIFSAYRAIYGVAYPEFVSLAQAAEAGRGEIGAENAEAGTGATKAGAGVAAKADAGTAEAGVAGVAGTADAAGVADTADAADAAGVADAPVIDTLFFPGCSLVSYAPDVMRAIGNWLTESGVTWCLSDGCCGSPLMSAGMFDRARALREGFISQMQAAGIKRMVTVCPGCADEFRDDLPEDIELVPLPRLMLELAKQREDAGDPTGFTPLPRASLTFFDSCHDRFDSSNANAIRELAARYIPQARQVESEHFKRGTLCCGAGGAVSGYDPAITDRRVWRVIDEARATGAETLVTMCPTCAYTIAQACLNAPDPAAGIDTLHYLELMFGVTIDWEQVFAQLGDMWTGEYGPWLAATFF